MTVATAFVLGLIIGGVVVNVLWIALCLRDRLGRSEQR